jgi:hypothetical protein
VIDSILQHIQEQRGGFVLILVGLSGTGKGTTMSVLREKLETQQSKQVVMWSNGNIFCSITLLAVTWCEQNGCNGFDATKALTKENIANYMTMLSFGKVHILLFFVCSCEHTILILSCFFWFLV